MSRSTTLLAGTLRVAVVGCGKIGYLHARAIAASQYASLVAVCDPQADRRESLARRFGVNAYENDLDLLEHEQLDAVTVATPDHLHVEPALRAMARGCQVFCEKPLAADLAGAQRMAATAQQQGVHLAVDYNRRFAFGYRTAKRLLDEGALGRLEHALLRVVDGMPSAEVARHPRVIFTTLLTHHLDLLRHFGGPVQWIQAQAGSPSAVGLLKSVNLTLGFAAGALGTIVAGYRQGLSRTSEWLELGGSTGSLVVEDVTRRVVLSGSDADSRQTFQPNHFVSGDAFYDSLVEHVQVFLEHVAHGRQPPVTSRDGCLAMQLAAAATDSLAAGRAIEVPVI